MRLNDACYPFASFLLRGNVRFLNWIAVWQNAMMARIHVEHRIHLRQPTQWLAFRLFGYIYVIFLRLLKAKMISPKLFSASALWCLCNYRIEEKCLWWHHWGWPTVPDSCNRTWSFFIQVSLKLDKFKDLNGPKHWNLHCEEKCKTTCHLYQAFSRDLHPLTQVYLFWHSSIEERMLVGGFFPFLVRWLHLSS